MSQGKLLERSRLAQILFTIFNLNDKIHMTSLIKKYSPPRYVPQEVIPKFEAGKIGDYTMKIFDDFEYSTAMAKLMMEHVIGKSLMDHKITCQNLMLNERTREIILRKVANKELSRVDFKMKSKRGGGAAAAA